MVVADLNESAARAVADEIQALGGKAIARSFDITDEASYKDLVDVTVKEFGRLDGLFNVAADLSPTTLSQDTDVLSVSLEVWRHTIDVTLTGYMYGIRHALPIMIDQGGGAIVNTMSTSVWMGEDTRVAYQSAKAGLYGLTRHTATLGGKHGVRCNSVAPGRCPGGFNKRAPGNWLSMAVRHRLTRSRLLRRALAARPGAYCRRGLNSECPQLSRPRFPRAGRRHLRST